MLMCAHAGQLCYAAMQQGLAHPQHWGVSRDGMNAGDQETLLDSVTSRNPPAVIMSGHRLLLDWTDSMTWASGDEKWHYGRPAAPGVGQVGLEMRAHLHLR